MYMYMYVLYNMTLYVHCTSVYLTVLIPYTVLAQLTSGVDPAIWKGGDRYCTAHVHVSTCNFLGGHAPFCFLSLIIMVHVPYQCVVYNGV